MGHYTGLLHLGREALGGDRVPVYSMPRMETFLSTNGPWSQLVALENIKIKSMYADSSVTLSRKLKVTPFLVPHRDEYSETVGYRIEGPEKTALFIPDIDKWSKWDRNIIEYIKEVDIALLDASFFKNGELKRDMNEIPHPFVEESMLLFKNLSDKDKEKIHFIHFNHTNPLLIEGSEAQKIVLKNGFKIADQEMLITF